MKGMIFAAAIAVMASAPASAEIKLEEWQEKALEKVKEYKRVEDAEWQFNTMLYLWANDADIDWDNIADQVTCNHLRDAGMPSGKNIQVVFYENAAALQGSAKRLGTAFCN